MKTCLILLAGLAMFCIPSAFAQDGETVLSNYLERFDERKLEYLAIDFTLVGDLGIVTDVNLSIKEGGERMFRRRIWTLEENNRDEALEMVSYYDGENTWDFIGEGGLDSVVVIEKKEPDNLNYTGIRTLSDFLGYRTVKSVRDKSYLEKVEQPNRMIRLQSKKFSLAQMYYFDEDWKLPVRYQGEANGNIIKDFTFEDWDVLHRDGEEIFFPRRVTFKFLDFKDLSPSFSGSLTVLDFKALPPDTILKPAFEKGRAYEDWTSGEVVQGDFGTPPWEMRRDVHEIEEALGDADLTLAAATPDFAAPAAESESPAPAPEAAATAQSLPQPTSAKPKKTAPLRWLAPVLLAVLGLIGGLYFRSVRKS
ncbi:MAG: hypothetical protein RLY93_10460 [Sumerlaeia bacterium]